MSAAKQISVLLFLPPTSHPTLAFLHHRLIFCTLIRQLPLVVTTLIKTIT